MAGRYRDGIGMGMCVRGRQRHRWTLRVKSHLLVFLFVFVFQCAVPLDVFPLQGESSRASAGVVMCGWMCR